jgi:predicted dehydrogenase
VLAHINVNWLSPVKMRTTLVGGQKKMLVWNDLDFAEKLRVYDKGAEVKNESGVHAALVSYRTGDMCAPKIEEREALKVETRYFLDCIQSGSKPFNDGQAGLRVVRILEAAEQSLNQHKEIVLA